MLTRIEVDGFKNLSDFTLDFGPYTCLLGYNAVGKSNMFDAIAFLSRTASAPLNEATAHLRGLPGDVREVFTRPDQCMVLAAEIIIPPSFKGDFGQEVDIDTTYVRYELEIELREKPLANSHVVNTIELVREELKPLTKMDAKSSLPWASTAFRDSAIRSRGAGEANIHTEPGLRSHFCRKTRIDAVEVP